MCCDCDYTTETVFFIDTELDGGNTLFLRNVPMMGDTVKLNGKEYSIEERLFEYDFGDLRRVLIYLRES